MVAPCVGSNLGQGGRRGVKTGRIPLRLHIAKVIGAPHLENFMKKRPVSFAKSGMRSGKAGRAMGERNRRPKTMRLIAPRHVGKGGFWGRLFTDGLIGDGPMG